MIFKLYYKLIYYNYCNFFVLSIENYSHFRNYFELDNSNDSQFLYIQLILKNDYSNIWKYYDFRLKF